MKNVIGVGFERLVTHTDCDVTASCFLAQNVQPQLALPPTMPEPAIPLEPNKHFLL